MSWPTTENPKDDAASTSRIYAGVCGTLALVGLSMAPLARFLRPLPESSGPIAIFIVGVLPNFGAGLALPFFLFVSLQNQLLRGRGLQLIPGFAHAAIIAFVALTAWEVIQWTVWSIPFDVNDILASGVGVALAAIVHSTLQESDNPQAESR